MNILEQKDNYIKLQITGVNNAICNGIRRVMMSEVETLAIDSIDFYQNDSVLNEDFIAHRLGLLPLHYTEGIEEATLELEVSNDTEENYKVLSGSLSGHIDCVYDNILLTVLRPGESLELKCYIKKGCGKEHSKWSPVSKCVYTLNEDTAVFEVEGVGNMGPLTTFKKSLVKLQEKLLTFNV